MTQTAPAFEQKSLFQLPPEGRTRHIVQDFDYTKTAQARETRQRDEELQSYLPPWLREIGWELIAEPDEGWWEEIPPTRYRAWYCAMQLNTYQQRTPLKAVAVAEHATLYYSIAGEKWPKGYRLHPEPPLFPDTYRYIEGIKTPSRVEYHKYIIPHLKKQEKYFSS